MIGKNAVITGNIPAVIFGCISLKNSKTLLRKSKRFLSHSSFSQHGSCSCFLCANMSGSFKSTQSLIQNASGFHSSSTECSPLLLTNQFITQAPRSRDLSEIMTQKREFAFSSTEAEDAQHIEQLLVNNKAWAKELKVKKPKEFAKLGINQTPQFLYFGCSDSRVPANIVLGTGTGDVFVHRNVGNLVPGNDLSVLAVLEFAVGHLGVTDILVTGHYNCGAVRAATTRQDLGTLENWLRSIRDVYRLHRDYLDGIINDEDRHKKLVELNVVEQCVNIYKTGIVQRKRLQNQKLSGAFELKNCAPRIHGLVFDTSAGLLHKLKFDFDSRDGSLDSIYGLY